MGEEAASPGLQAVCEQQREALRADLLIACDGPRVSAARPTLFLGSRGAVNFSLRVRARSRGYHSGNWGGVLIDPATVLSHAVASLVDARGRILVEALRPPPIPAWCGGAGPSPSAAAPRIRPWMPAGASRV